jgi:hypothetical protein
LLQIETQKLRVLPEMTDDLMRNMDLLLAVDAILTQRDLCLECRCELDLCPPDNPYRIAQELAYYKAVHRGEPIPYPCNTKDSSKDP